MKIISTNIGVCKEIDWKGKKVTTGIFKFPVTHSVFLDTKGVLSDEISDKEHHGGTLQAVYGYSFKHYEYWKSLFPGVDFQMGIFGENLTIDDLDETIIHQGDTFNVGEAILEATLQRNPCMKLGVRFDEMKIVKQFWNTTFCGVYFKVLQTGFVSSGDEFIQIKSCLENPTIAELYAAKKISKGI